VDSFENQGLLTRLNSVEAGQPVANFSSELAGVSRPLSEGAESLLKCLDADIGIETLLDGELSRSAVRLEHNGSIDNIEDETRCLHNNVCRLKLL
jgi:hypothetical protein